MTAGFLLDMKEWIYGLHECFTKEVYMMQTGSVAGT